MLVTLLHSRRHSKQKTWVQESGRESWTASSMQIVQLGFSGSSGGSEFIFGRLTKKLNTRKCVKKIEKIWFDQNQFFSEN